MPTQPEFRNGAEDVARTVGIVSPGWSASVPKRPESDNSLWRQPELRNTILEASCSLALLDADRLEELALELQKLNSDVRLMRPAERADLSRQAQEAAKEMAVFARVLDATLANLTVMRRLRDLRQGCFEYEYPPSSAPETIHGND